ncbi:MAG: carbohydrate kinase, YjeF related protein [Halonotius sp. J07HN4]|nr:MAG: carbohydrate kinase, YjeF related protein [Halonotius sp. J07HN4]
MESSGNALARVVQEHAEPGDRVALVCGRGNNGGDAFVAARFLGDYDVEVVLLGHPDRIGTDIARENWVALQATEIPTTTITDSTDIDGLGVADVVVDAMVGTGVSGALREPAATAAAAINAAESTVVAVDVPSGVDADTGTADGVAVDADHVITFHDTKPGLEAIDATVTVADIGIPAAAERVVGPGDLLSRRRAADSHKGDHGELLVIGGGPYTGAPALAGQAALRAGADLVHVACPASVAPQVQGYSENLIVHPLAGEQVTPAVVDDLLARAAAVDTVVCGPGLGDSDTTREAVQLFLDAYDGRAVVDADALSVVPTVDTDATLVCTPHQGELVGMGGPNADDREQLADSVVEFAAELGHTLLVKGAHDIISDGETTRHNRTGNPGMTVGGTGDVLAGVTGALLATEEPLSAAAVGAYATGRAGDLAADIVGDSLVATDLLDRLPEAFVTDE